MWWPFWQTIRKGFNNIMSKCATLFHRRKFGQFTTFLGVLVIILALVKPILNAFILICVSVPAVVLVFTEMKGWVGLPVGDIVFPVFHTSILSMLVTATGLARPLLFQVFQYEVIHLWWTDSWYTRLKSCMVFLTCIAKVLTVQIPMLFFWVQMWRFYRHVSHVHPQVVYLLQ